MITSKACFGNTTFGELLCVAEEEEVLNTAQVRAEEEEVLGVQVRVHPQEAALVTGRALLLATF